MSSEQFESLRGMAMKKVLAMLLILIFILIGCSQQEEVEEQEIYTPVEVIDAKTDSIEFITTFTGRVRPIKTIPVIIQMPGEVARLFVENGDKVSSGQNLFTLVGTNSARQLEQAQAAYDSAKANYEMTKEQVEAAKENYEKLKVLYESGAISQSQLDQARLSASDQPIKAAESAVRQAKVGLDSASDAYRDTTIKAPSSGIVTNLVLEEGSIATNTQPAMVILDDSELLIGINITENMVNNLVVGQEVGVNIQAIDYYHEGRISSIGSSIEASSLMYGAEITLEKVDSDIKTGMHAKVEIVTESREDAIVIPSQAVLIRNNREIVYLVQDDKAVVVEIKTGLDNGSIIEVVSGINEGDEVVVSGQSFLSEGDRVRVIRGE
jgi:RND family efflux transporter MFP subunit